MSDQEHHLRTIIETLERENAALRALTKEASLALDGNWHERVDMIKNWMPSTPRGRRPSREQIDALVRQGRKCGL